MADQSVPSSSRLAIAVATGDDPIEVIQTRVMHAHALCKVIADSSESVSTYEEDLMSALCGLADILNDIHLDLDPKEFRAMVLSSEQAAPEVANV